MNFRDLFGCGSSGLQKELKPSALGVIAVLEEYEVHHWRYFFFPKATQYSFFTAHGPPYYQERIPISVYSLNVMKYMENRITQWTNSTLDDKGTNLIRLIF